MYRIEDRQSYVTAIQNMLGVPKTGRLDKRTLSAVAAVKQRYGIKSTDGIADVKQGYGLNNEYGIDYEAFLAIKDYYRRRRNDLLCDKIYPFDTDGEVRGINEMLRRAIVFYSLPYRLPKGSVYGYDSQRAVLRLKQIYSLKNDSVIDGEFYCRLLKDISSFNANCNC